MPKQAKIAIGLKGKKSLGGRPKPPEGVRTWHAWRAVPSSNKNDSNDSSNSYISSRSDSSKECSFQARLEQGEPFAAIGGNNLVHNRFDLTRLDSRDQKSY